MRRILSILASVLVLTASVSGQANAPEYVRLQHSMARGWDTWNSRSVTSHVLLPAGLAIDIGFKHNAIYQESWLPELLVGRQGPDTEQVSPGIHTPEPHLLSGRYTSLDVQWRGHTFKIQSATERDDLVLLVTPEKDETPLPPTAVFSVHMLWNRNAAIQKSESVITAKFASGAVKIYFDGNDATDYGIPASGPYFASELDRPLAVSTGQSRSVAEIQAIIARTQKAAEGRIIGSGPTHEVQSAIQSVLGWDTIYEPEHARVVTPVSRIFNMICDGYILFEWDNFFAATLAATYDRDLAYANAMETLNGETGRGFVPNFARAKDWKSLDRSEPPVGSMTVMALYRQFHDRWFLADAYPRLLRWNRWWGRNRDVQGYLVYGSDPYDAHWRNAEGTVNTAQAAKYESGMDNSPIYDGITFDKQTHRLLLADVGLMSLYIHDCDALAEIATELGHGSDAAELGQRADRYRKRLGTLWDEKTGAFLNKDLRTGALSSRLSPNIFYPLLAHAATPQQAERLVHDHLLNPDEFWGEWVIPSIARNDVAFSDQNYWRGRIWPPMNYLTYLGLRAYGFEDVRRQMAQKSFDLLMRDRRISGHIRENYNGTTGSGDDVSNSDRFYHWGSLLGLIATMEQGTAP
jgi:hypothetical protein